MTTPPQPQKPQLPPQVRGLFPADMTGATPRLAPEHRLELAARVTARTQRDLGNRGILTGREFTPTGIDLRIKHGDNEKHTIAAALIAETLRAEWADLGITVTSEQVDGVTYIHIKT